MFHCTTMSRLGSGASSGGREGSWRRMVPSTLASRGSRSRQASHPRRAANLFCSRSALARATHSARKTGSRLTGGRGEQGGGLVHEMSTNAWERARPNGLAQLRPRRGRPRLGSPLPGRFQSPFFRRGVALLSSRPSTLRELEQSGYRSRSVKDEMRANLIRILRAGEPLFPGIVGYTHTVEPQIVNAILSRHDFILLGLRGQAKTRILRALARFLDEWMPAVEGCPLHSHPFHPLTHHARALIQNRGADTPIEWIS